jgi:hypothetical protein
VGAWVGDKIITSLNELTDEGYNGSFGGGAPPVTDETDFGFDGYWERRSINQGVRIIVGQRLELGNTFGWINEDLNADGTLNTDGGGGDLWPYDEDRNYNDYLDFDPLYPAIRPVAEAAGTMVGGISIAGQYLPVQAAGEGDVQTGSGSPDVSESTLWDRAHEQKQWRTLRDNLAAVQSTAVYHYLSDAGQYPVACMATTAHPGTDYTDERSRTFDVVSGQLYTDFLTGKGTNGMEFIKPFANATNPYSEFITQVNNASSPLRIALENLAYLAGDDPYVVGDTDADGNDDDLRMVAAYPPSQATSFTTSSGSTTVNFSARRQRPDPLMTMWGNFTELRRIIEMMNDTSAATTIDADGDGDYYEELSPADQTTLQTATCTLGMLAYNLSLHESLYTSPAGTVDLTDTTAYPTPVDLANFSTHVAGLIRSGGQ